MLAFEKATSLQELTGIELDIQLSKDGQMVVFHDERVDRTTNGTGEVQQYTLSELKNLQIDAENGKIERIPTIEEVLDLLEPRMKKGFLLNIELKNSNIPYLGMEEKIVDLVYKRGIQKSVVYSSFCALSLERIRRLDQKAEIGMLDTKVSDCLYKVQGGCGANALHPYWQGMDLPIERLKEYPIRAWFGGHLYPEKPTGTKLDITLLEEKGITDVFFNEPERYVI